MQKGTWWHESHSAGTCKHSPDIPVVGLHKTAQADDGHVARVGRDLGPQRRLLDDGGEAVDGLRLYPVHAGRLLGIHGFNCQGEEASHRHAEQGLYTQTSFNELIF